MLSAFRRDGTVSVGKRDKRASGRFASTGMTRNLPVIELAVANYALLSLSKDVADCQGVQAMVAYSTRLCLVPEGF